MTDVSEKTAEREPIVGSGPVADLTGYRSAEELATIGRIKATCIVVRESLAAAVSRIPSNASATIIVPEDVEARIQTGMVTLGGEGLAPEDGPNQALVIVGGLIIVGAVPEVTYRQISVVGMALMPQGSESMIGPRLKDLVGGVKSYAYHEGMQFRSLAGDVSLSAAMIANESGSPNDILIAAGNIIIDEPITSVGYQLIIASGQLIAPRDGRDQLGSRLEMSGEALWYRGDQPRVIGDETYDAAFLSLVDEPLSLIVQGDLTFADDVTNELIKGAVADIVLTGTITVPKAAHAAVQLLTRENHGSIVIAEA